MRIVEKKNDIHLAILSRAVNRTVYPYGEYTAFGRTVC